MNTKMMIAALLSICVAGASSFTARAADADLNVNNADGQTKVQLNTNDADQPANLQANQNNMDQAVQLTASERDAIRTRIADALNAAVSDNGFDDLVGSFAQADRTRIKASSFTDLSGLKEAAQKFRTAFHDKYNKDFDISAQQLSFLTIRGGGENAFVNVSQAGQQTNWNRSNDQRNMQDMHSTDQNRMPQSSMNSGAGNAYHSDGLSTSANAQGNRADLNLHADQNQAGARLNADGASAQLQANQAQANANQAQINANQAQANADWKSGQLTTSGEANEIRMQRTDVNRDYQRSANSASLSTNGSAEISTPSNVGMPRGDEKHPSVARVDVQQPDGSVTTNVPVPASAVRSSGTIYETQTASGENIEVGSKGESGLRATHAIPSIPATHVPSETLNQSVAAANVDSGDVNTTHVESAREVNANHMDSAQQPGAMSDHTGMMAMNQRGQIHLVKENRIGNDWRINVPDSVTKEQLISSLQTHLNQMASNSQQWPQDVDAGYRTISQNLLQAITQPSTTGLSSER